MSRNYDFKNLSPFDFEVLCRDLLSRELEVEFEIFPQGRDGGIDLQWLPEEPDDYGVIVQCKHYSGSSYSSLKTVLRKERKKLECIEPERYILATSQSLTAENKREILAILAPYVSGSGDIYGREQINALLGKFPEVERVNQKLWATSAGVLQSIINASIFKRSRLFLERAMSEALLFVRGDTFDVALRHLESENIIIISGIPGIGKTTLAHMLVIDSLKSGYDFFQVSKDVEEAFGVYNSEKQVFLYDDFLGATSLAGGQLSKNEGDRLLTMIESVRRNPSKRLILTTRDYVLAAAQKMYERLNDPEFKINRLVLKPQDLTKVEKARILFNHIYYSALKTEQKESILIESAYNEIIAHPNYNPRHISEIVKNARIQKAKNLRTFFQTYLAQPEKIWRHPFQRDIGRPERTLLLVLATYPYPVPLSDFRVHCIEHLAEDEPVRSFEDALSNLDDNFISLSRLEGKVLISFFNPSVKDFVEKELVRDPALLAEVLNRSVDFEQCEEVVRKLSEISPDRLPEVTAIFEKYANNLFSASNSPLRRMLKYGRWFRRNFAMFDTVPVSVRLSSLIHLCRDEGLQVPIARFDELLAVMLTKEICVEQEGLKVLELFQEEQNNEYAPQLMNLRELVSQVENILFKKQPCPRTIADYGDLASWYPEILESRRTEFSDLLMASMDQFFEDSDSESADLAAEAIQFIALHLRIELPEDPMSFARAIRSEEEEQEYDTQLDLAHEARAEYQEELAESATIECMFRNVAEFDFSPQ